MGCVMPSGEETASVAYSNSNRILEMGHHINTSISAVSNKNNEGCS
jgi:hypothetical protein